MTFLNEGIKIDLTLQDAYTGYVKFMLEYYDVISNTYVVIFKGSKYINNSDEFELDITEIVNDYASTITLDTNNTRQDIVIKVRLSVENPFSPGNYLYVEKSNIYAKYYSNDFNDEDKNIWLLAETEPAIIPCYEKLDMNDSNGKIKLSPRLMPIIPRNLDDQIFRNFAIPIVTYKNANSSSLGSNFYYLGESIVYVKSATEGVNVYMMNPVNRPDFATADGIYMGMSNFIESKVFGYNVVADAIMEGADYNDAKEFLMEGLGYSEEDADYAMDRLDQGKRVVLSEVADLEEASAIFSEASIYFDAAIEEIRAEVPIKIPFAKISDCGDYYVAWIDRFGGFQCQPFCKKTTMKESFNRVNVMGHNGRKKVASNSISTSWELHSDFVTDDLYAEFESLFVSPSVALIDVKNQQWHNVLVTDSSYTEKTYNNQGKKILSLVVNLVEDKNQNMIF